MEQLEEERAWREAEIRFLDNSQRSLEKEEDRMLMRRSILCLIYAHIEGFVKFSFSLYVDEINKKNLLCYQVKPVIAAATLSREFLALSENRKSKIFRSDLSDDKHLRKLFRQAEFIENIFDVKNYEVKIPEEYINTEDNVGITVLEKLMCKVGLDHTDLRDVNAPLGRLLNVRNDISHGKRRAGIDHKDYEEFLNCCKSVISGLSRKLTLAFDRQAFLVAS
ncbi:hypothetical protein GCM10011613_05460 [Cellvibrio zantedeschiae]|uniref:RiboL-PSP-HEPN domain-containing protein n=1 Tax=Cellvibrio zantedeschiae TaxID=1237077 RepID=A0ABQ3AR17_9GAMM|nr:hypothetical protein GCM10011613_05460 [Cellvibrio zantedeschiae]